MDTKKVVKYLIITLAVLAMLSLVVTWFFL